MNGILVPALSAALLVIASGGTASAQCAASARADHEVQSAALARHAGPDLVDTAVAAGKFNTLAAALTAAGLVDTLKGDGPFTVFAPTDEAFAKLPKGTVETLLKPENKEKLKAILLYHVAAGQVLAKDVATMPLPTINGQRAEVVVKSGKVMIDKATVTQTDVVAGNGVIHIIDTVLMPSDKTIVETAVAAGNFKTLARLLEHAELVEALQGAGPFTVFAPTDEAFAKLPKETVESLLKPENKATLAGILTYHVVPGRIFSDAAAKGASAKTLQGTEVHTLLKDGKVRVGNATVVSADIDAGNGVIHAIDTVLMPK